MRSFTALIVILITHATLQAEVITLTSGEVLKAPIAGQTDQAVTFQHPILGELTVPRTSIASIAADPEQAAQPAGEPEPKVPPVENQPERGGLFIGWKGQLEAGFSATRGNSETSNVRVVFKAKKESELHRWNADTGYYLSRDHDNTTKNEFTAGLLKDWLQPDSPWFYFAQGRYDYDEFEAWEQRVSGSAGVGYQWIKNDKLDVLFRAGLGGTKELGDQANDLHPEAILGGELAWKITDNQSLEASTYYLPDLGDWPQSRIRSAVGWKIRIDQLDGLSVKLGLENEYETETEDDSKHNDLKLFSALVFEF